ncbi:MAG: PAS domain-containing protein [Betaproteobacteria bacterium]|nr:PAS domain-containing protein [Betaproteobacteria bacterium]
MDSIPGSIDLKKITPREQQILELVLTGNTSKQIARILKISPRTVEIHRTNILRRCGVTSTPQIVNLILKSAKDLEQQLSRSSNHLNEAQKIAHLGSWTVYLDSKEIEWSEEMYHLFECNPDSFVPNFDNLFEYILDEDKEKIKSKFNESLANNQPFEASYKIMTNSGREKYIRSNGVFHKDQNGLITYMTGISQDITYENDLKNHLLDDRYHALLNSVSDVVFIMSKDWGELTKLIGKDLLDNCSEPVKNWLDKYIYPEDHESFINNANTAYLNKTSFQMKHRLIKRDSTIVWVYSHAMPIFNDKNQIIEWLGVTYDLNKMLST